MVISEQMLNNFKAMPVTHLDEQILFLCKNNKFDGIVTANTIYQQFKTAVVLKNSEAEKVFEAIILNWIDKDDIEMLKLYADIAAENFSQDSTLEV